MATISSSAELRKMPIADLRQEVADLRQNLAKQRLGLELNKEKDSASYRAGRRQLARMATILNERESGSAVAASPELKISTKTSTVSAHSSGPKGREKSPVTPV